MRDGKQCYYINDSVYHTFSGIIFDHCQYPLKAFKSERYERNPDLEKVALEWAQIINAKSPTAMRMIKYGFNLPDDGMVGQQLFAGEATRLGYGTDEAVEGRDAFIQKRKPDFDKFPWHY